MTILSKRINGLPKNTDEKVKRKNRKNELYWRENLILLLVKTQIEVIEIIQTTAKAVGLDKKTSDEEKDKKAIKRIFNVENSSMFSNLKEIQ